MPFTSPRRGTSAPPGTSSRPAPEAWRHTAWKRWTTVTAVNTSIKVRSATSPSGTSSAAIRKTNRSPLSIKPFDAVNPSASPLALSYEISIDSTITAAGIAATAPADTPTYHVTPPNTNPSLTLSATESKNWPLGELLALARATAPSRRSGRPDAATSSAPHHLMPDPTASPAAADVSRPSTVSWSAVTPSLDSAAPTGVVTRSRSSRKRELSTLPR